MKIRNFASFESDMSMQIPRWRYQVGSWVCESQMQSTSGLELELSYRTESQWTGLPWWSSCYESACQGRGHGFSSWSGKLPHAVEQLSPIQLQLSAIQLMKPVCLEPVLHNEKPLQREA